MPERYCTNDENKIKEQNQCKTIDVKSYNRIATRCETKTKQKSYQWPFNSKIIGIWTFSIMCAHTLHFVRRHFSTETNPFNGKWILYTYTFNSWRSWFVARGFVYVSVCHFIRQLLRDAKFVWKLRTCLLTVCVTRVQYSEELFITCCFSVVVFFPLSLVLGCCCAFVLMQLRVFAWTCFCARTTQ